MEPVIAFALGGLFTAGVGALFAELRARWQETRDSRRAEATRIREWNLRRLEHTRVGVLRYCRWLRAFAIGNHAQPPIDTSDIPMYNMALVGQEGGRALFETVPFRAEDSAITKGLSVYRLEHVLLGLLEDQELRALKGEPLREMTEELAAMVGQRLPSS